MIQPMMTTEPRIIFTMFLSDADYYADYYTVFYLTQTITLALKICSTIRIVGQENSTGLNIEALPPIRQIFPVYIMCINSVVGKCVNSHPINLI